MFLTTQAQVVDLLQFLDTDNPTARGIERHLDATFGAGNHCSVSYLIKLARYDFGDDIVKGEWIDWEYHYRTARSAEESLGYVARRCRIIRNSVHNQTRLLDRATAKFPSEQSEVMASARTHLMGAVYLLDGVHN